MITQCDNIECLGWLELRLALWPHVDSDHHLAEMRSFVSQPDRFVQYIAYDTASLPVGLVEASIRTDYVNGAESTPVAFLEGIYVVPAARRRGVARSLVSVVENWALSHNCTELASDALIQNSISHSFHRAAGFEETERVVYFRKVLGKE
jgi:aminoglycoside 6'-N-acetyltransferase I